ncbi:aminotransferase class V-fold PLP-dependent enzyme [Marinitenerispora sediminis]|uniref:Cysteine desulfurase n=1 Tax=Marinitenerispora sediminis TaxID=1931232 RepID=A0A368T5F2_9ACTN|nr:aminotransferase class V-fold PLP-dependent enzyme [Marinitenerispora sediminis]RCV51410.1 cysteine desulfurase [Marinitenerispora sediminis]RCV57224.1 cysteine desulfurase [Marinitenerispora sediminis]RCV58578.1 cysteine desulfurase [Marinitenerispora sediminis]
MRRIDGASPSVRPEAGGTGGGGGARTGDEGGRPAGERPAGPGGPVPGPGGSAAVCPELAATAVLDRLREREYRYLDADGHVYLDYAGAGLAARSQLRSHVRRLDGACFGNPHTGSPTSAASSELVEGTRAAVLTYFNAPPDEYTVVFTANATAACRLVGEAYPFRPGRRFVQLLDNHNSVLGIREFARAGGAAIETVGLTGPELRGDEDGLHAVLRRSAARLRLPRRGAAGGRSGLFGYPAQSNFTGVRHPLEWVDLAHEYGFDVLLDAAGYVPTELLDLSRVKPDFVPVSWYKLFGYPTGLGCLVARREALARLERPWFAGGTVQAASVLGDWYHLAAAEAAFEDGTLNFLSIPDITVGLDWLTGIGMEVVGTRVRCLTGRLLDRLTALRHSTGVPLVRVYGPTDTAGRGGTVAFNFLDPGGAVVDERAVARDAAAHRISLRTGCFCNPGAGEAAFNLDRSGLAAASARGLDDVDAYLDHLRLPSGGAVRVSVGLASNLADITRFLEFAADTYLDRDPSEAGLRPRERC